VESSCFFGAHIAFDASVSVVGRRNIVIPFGMDYGKN